MTITVQSDEPTEIVYAVEWIIDGKTCRKGPSGNTGFYLRKYDAEMAAGKLKFPAEIVAYKLVKMVLN